MSRRLLSRASSVALSSAIAAFVAAAPTAWRLASHGASFMAAETAVAAVLFLPLAAGVSLLEPLRDRWSERTSSISGARGLALLLATFLFLGPSFIVAKVLVAHTHHRGLGGVTFAVIAIGMAAVAIVIGWRAARYASTESPRLRSLLAAVNRVAWWALGFLGVGAGAALLAIAARPGGAAADASFATLVATVMTGAHLSTARNSEGASKGEAGARVSSNRGTWASAIAAGVLSVVLLAGAVNLGTISSLRTSFGVDAPLEAALLDACGLGGTPAGPVDPAER